MTFDQHLVELCKAGKITPEVARAAATNRLEFDKAMAAERAAAPPASEAAPAATSPPLTTGGPEAKSGTDDGTGKTYSFV